MNFSLIQSSNKLFFNYTDLYTLFNLGTNDSSFFSVLSIKISFQGQISLFSYNISFKNQGVLNISKDNWKIDYANCNFNGIKKLQFPAGIYYFNVSSKLNFFQLYIMDTDGKLFDYFIEFNIEVIINPFCMQNSIDSQYEIINGEKPGIKAIYLKCDRALKKGKIQIVINKTMVGNEIEFEVLPNNIAGTYSFFKSNFIPIKEIGKSAKISFEMYFFDFFGNIFEGEAINQVNILLENSRKDSHLKIINNSGEKPSYQV